MDVVWQLPCVMKFRGDRLWSRNRRTKYSGGVMLGILVFVRSYRVVRYRKGFRLADSVHYGLWLARG
jgi:hypothetical protein